MKVDKAAMEVAERAIERWWNQYGQGICHYHDPIDVARVKAELVDDVHVAAERYGDERARDERRSFAGLESDNDLLSGQLVNAERERDQFKAEVERLRSERLRILNVVRMQAPEHVITRVEAVLTEGCTIQHRETGDGHEGTRN